MRCKICESATDAFGTLKVLVSFEARYRRCRSCGFVFIEAVNWLELAYSSAIAASDTGIVVRNLKLADAAALLIPLAFSEARRFLDYGGGAGLLVRLLRDRGFDFRLQDKYCTNVFARGFEAQPGERFDLVTCMELVEHLVDPLPTFAELADLAPAMLFSTELLPRSRNRPGEWWYYAPETGQHVSFYTRKSLQVIGERLGRRLATNGSNLHLLSIKPVSDRLLKLVASRKAKALAKVWVSLPGKRRRPLTKADARAFQVLREPSAASEQHIDKSC
jgi:hypothetical protein